MRVVAGTARGRRLEAPPGMHVRPTSDRVREAVFNALGSLGAVEGARVLDLFAGSGALGIEALSRGAAAAVFVEQDRAARAALDANLATTDLVEQAEVVPGDALRFVERAAGRFDLVLLDPPYAFDDWPALLSALTTVGAPGAIVVLESDREVALPESWRVERRKRYGSTFVAITRQPESSAPSRTESS